MGRALRIGAALSAAIGFGAATASGQVTTRESVDALGAQANSDSYLSGISKDGNFVAFYSYATNLVAGDTNGFPDCFLRDRTTGTVTRVSVRSNGTEGNSGSYSPVVSGNGNIVAFYSDARNLVAGDTNLMTDVFVHNLTTKITRRVSVDSAGTESNGFSTLPQVSADGLIVAFESTASNLVAGDGNGVSDIFVHDRTTLVTTRVSVDSGGGEGNGPSNSARMSANGQFIFFYSSASNLIASDTNGFIDAFVHDRATGVTTRVTVDSFGAEGDATSYNGTITEDGSKVAFYSLATNLVAGDTNGQPDVFVHDRTTGITTRESTDSFGGEGDLGSFTARISADGTFLVFVSDATNMVTGDTNSVGDVFRKDLLTGETIRLSVDSSGVESNNTSSLPWNSGDGRYTAFQSTASNLVPADTNGNSDVFLRDMCSPASWSNYGVGWPGSLGVPTLYSSGPPVLGSTITVTLTNSAGVATAAVVILGFSQASLPTNKDGTLLVTPFQFIPVGLPAAGLAAPVTLPPMDPALCGAEVDFQALEVDLGASKKLSFTDGMQWILGI